MVNCRRMLLCDWNLKNFVYKMSSEILDPVWVLLKCFGKTLRNELLQTSVFNTANLVFCIFLLMFSLYYYTFKIIPLCGYMKLHARECRKVVFCLASVTFLVLSLYYSLYDDAKASLFTFLGIALNVWTRRYALAGIKSLNHPILKIVEFVSYFLVVLGLLLLACKLWTTGLYLICLGTIVEKAVNEMRHSLRVSEDYLHLNDEASQNDEIQALDEPKISHQVNNVPEDDCDQHDFLEPEEKLHELELSDFLKLENSSQVNSVINHYFEVFTEIQEGFSGIKGSSQEPIDTVIFVSELKSVISEFAQMLEAAEDRERKDELVQNEVTLEECYGSNFLTREFVRQFLRINRCYNRHFRDDLKIELRVGLEASSLVNHCVDLINMFKRELTLIRKSENRTPFVKTAVNEMNEKVNDFKLSGNVQRLKTLDYLAVISDNKVFDDDYLLIVPENEQLVDQVFEPVHMESFENKQSLEIRNLDNVEINQSVTQINKTINSQISQNEHHNIHQNRETSPSKINKSSNEYANDRHKLVGNEVICEATNLKVPDHNGRSKLVHERIVDTASSYSRVPFKKRLSKIYQLDPPKKRLCKRYQQDQCDEDPISRYDQKQGTSKYSIMKSSNVRTANIISDENSDSTKVRNVDGSCGFQSAESEKEIERPIYSSSESDGDVLEVDRNRTGDIKDDFLNQASPDFENETSDQLEVTTGSEVQLVSGANRRELTPEGSYELEVHDDVNNELKEVNDVFNSPDQGKQHAVSEEPNALAHKKVENNQISRELPEQNACFLRSTAISEETYFLTQSFRNAPLITSKFESMNEINFKEMVALNTTIAFNSRMNVELFKERSSSEDVSTNGCQTVESKTKALKTDADNRTKSLPPLSCVEGIVNRIDVRFIYGLH